MEGDRIQSIALTKKPIHTEKKRIFMSKLNLTLRQRKLLRQLQNSSGFVTGPVLAKSLEVSSRTIRSDVICINTVLKEHRAQVESVHSKGYRLIAEDPDLLAAQNQIDTAFFSREDRVSYLAFRLCMSSEALNCYDWEEETFISHSTFENDLHQLKLRYVLGQPKIDLISKKGFFSFAPDEKKRRRILHDLLFDSWNYNNSRDFFGRDFLDEELLSYLGESIPPLLRRCRLAMEDSHLISLNLTCAIMYARCKKGHELPVCPAIPREDPLSSLVTRKLVDSLERRLSCSFNQSEQDELYRIISSGRLVDMNQVNPENPGASFGPCTCDMADEYLELIRETFALDLRNDEDFYITLLQFIRFLQSPVRLFNNQDNRIIVKEHLLTALEPAWLFQSIALKHMGYYLRENELLHLSYCLSGAMELLQEHHPESKISAVLYCHLHMSIAWALKRRILGAFDKYLNLTDLLPVNAKSGYDFSATDLILSTVTREINPGTDSLTISPYMTPADYTRIQNYIQQNILLKLYPANLQMLADLRRNYRFEEIDCPENTFSAISQIANSLGEEGLVDEAFLQDLLRREALCTTVFQSGFVLLASQQPAIRTSLTLQLLRHRMSWGNYRIRVIATATLRGMDIPLLFHLRHYFAALNESTDVVNQIHSEKDLRDLMQKFPPTPALNMVRG